MVRLAASSKLCTGLLEDEKRGRRPLRTVGPPGKYPVCQITSPVLLFTFPQRSEDNEAHPEDTPSTLTCATGHSGGLSEYELQRLENIKQNRAFLTALHLPQVLPESSKPRPKPSAKGISRYREKNVEVLPLRKSLRLQSRDTIAPPLSEARVVAPVFDFPVAPKPGPIAAVPVNIDGELPERLLELWVEDPPKQEERPLEVKRYQSALQKMFIDSNAVVKVVKDRIFSAAFHPCSSSLLMAAGDKSGHLGLWNLGADWGHDGVLLFEPHSRPITCLAFSSQPSNLLSVSYDGTARSLDLQSAVFEEVYRSEFGLKTFDFLSGDCSTLLIGHSDGDVAIVDRRTPGTSYESLHTLDPKTLRGVHVHPVHRQYFVAAESRSVNMYDCRHLKRSNSSPVSELSGHSLSISSAFFSPATGNRVLTTCMDNNIRVFDTSTMVTCVPLLSTTKHFMQTGRWLSKLSAVWDAKQEDCFVIGSMDRPRRVQVYHESGRLLHSLQDEELLTTVCSITACHPSRHAVLGGNSSGRLHVFSDR